MQIIPILGVGSALPIPGKEVLAQDEIKEVEILPKIINKRDTEFFRWVGYITLGLIAPLFTTIPGNKAINYIAQNIVKIVPKPIEETDRSLIDGHRYNGFLANHERFKKVVDVLKQIGFSPEHFDTNSDGIILNSNDEIDALKEYFQHAKDYIADTALIQRIDESLTILNELHTVEKYVFGINGMQPENFRQGIGLGSCQNQAVEKELAYTTKNQQYLKSAIEIEKIDPVTGEIHGVRHIHGKRIPFTFSDLEDWMSTKEHVLPQSKDGSLALSLIEQGIEIADDSYDSIPYLLQSTPAILLTNKDFVTLYVPTIDDEQLKNILLNAPQKLITVGGIDETQLLSPTTVSALIAEKLSHPSFRDLLDRSPEKADEFRNSTKERMQSITGNTIANNSSTTDTNPQNKNPQQPTQIASLLPRSSETTNSSSGIESTITVPIQQNHQYAIEKVERDGDDLKITVTDAHGVRYPELNLEKFRECMDDIVLEKGDAPNWSTRSTIASLLILLGLITTRTAANGLIRKLAPDSGIKQEKLKD